EALRRRRLEGLRVVPAGGEEGRLEARDRRSLPDEKLNRDGEGEPQARRGNADALARRGHLRLAVDAGPELRPGNACARVAQHEARSVPRPPARPAPTGAARLDRDVR